MTVTIDEKAVEAAHGEKCPHCRGTGQPGGIMGGPEFGLCSWCKGSGRAVSRDEKAVPEDVRKLAELHGSVAHGRFADSRVSESLGTSIRNAIEQAIMADRATHPASRSTTEAVGEAGAMPGTTGFTMAAFEAAKVPVGTRLYAAPVADRDTVGEADKQRMDWLETMTVNVRQPLVYGSHDRFWAGPEQVDGDVLPSDLRKKVDAARTAQSTGGDRG